MIVQYHWLSVFGIMYTRSYQLHRKNRWWLTKCPPAQHCVPTPTAATPAQNGKPCKQQRLPQPRDCSPAPPCANPRAGLIVWFDKLTIRSAPFGKRLVSLPNHDDRLSNQPKGLHELSRGFSPARMVGRHFGKRRVRFDSPGVFASWRDHRHRGSGRRGDCRAR